MNVDPLKIFLAPNPLLLRLHAANLEQLSNDLVKPDHQWSKLILLSRRKLADRLMTLFNFAAEFVSARDSLDLIPEFVDYVRPGSSEEWMRHLAFVWEHGIDDTDPKLSVYEKLSVWYFVFIVYSMHFPFDIKTRSYVSEDVERHMTIFAEYLQDIFSLMRSCPDIEDCALFLSAYDLLLIEHPEFPSLIVELCIRRMELEKLWNS